jgi:universal stress protein A
MKRTTAATSKRAGKTARVRTATKRSMAKSARARVIDLVPAVMKLRNILVPIDFSPSSNKALNYALSFAEQFGAKLTLINVVEPAVYPTELGYVPIEIDALHRGMQNTAREKLAELTAKRVSGAFRANALVRVGRPHIEITAAAKELRADLIVIATHGYTGLKHAIMGSTAERVVRHAPCPVLTVREKEHDFV